MAIRECRDPPGWPGSPFVRWQGSLAERGGGTGLFTGCAAGDTGAAVIIRVDD